MNYRELGRTGLQVSEIGIGCEGFIEEGGALTKDLIDLCEEAGINYIDLYTSNPEARSTLGQALARPTGEIYLARASVHHLAERPVQADPPA